ncbi:Retrovirus-related Pol polyprotein from transposon RE1 [Sesamum angolense]|uniref:Retrovirus-related Pol polyprotein from transposon RE1 n=1 Tax=Sesamum angolense TaxID=2727404 RepID=A0AAE2BTR0_9LAMI|nr:Retrovirus-related Pol polyprotein from transposon RE1 [Sesamum angolense]
MGYYSYDPTEQKVFVSRNAVFFEKGFPIDTRHEELFFEESSEATPEMDAVASSAPLVPTNDIPVLRRSTRARLIANGYTQRPGVNFEETYSPVAMAMSIQIMLVIAEWYNYEICQMDMKMVFLNGFVEEEIYMDQSEGFTSGGEEQKNVSRSSIAFLVLYVDDILFIGNDVKMLGDTKAWLSIQFSMKDLDVAFTFSVTSRYQAYAGETHWTTVKNILKYLKRTKDTFLIYGGGELILKG